MTEDDNNAAPLERLLAVMARLRDPDGGCAWDLEQDFASIAPHTIEEAYEVVDAIERRDMDGLRDELGDLLLQVVFHCQMARERGLFDFDAVADHVTRKMISRHPHVFGDKQASSPEDVIDLWEARKTIEQQNADGADGTERFLLDQVTRGLPALRRAVKLQKKAARVGFEWKNVEQVLGKLHEELTELAEARESRDADRVEDEFGDMLFVLTNIGRLMGVDSEEALRKANNKFQRRFTDMERMARSRGETLDVIDDEAREALWGQAKLRERTGT